MVLFSKARRSGFFAAASFLACVGLAAQAPGDATRYPEFTIVQTQRHQSEGVAFNSVLEVGFRLSSMWQSRAYSPGLQAILREQGLSPEASPAKEWMGAYVTGGTPKDLFRRRGSILGMKPGERLQFYTASNEGRATDNSGAAATVTTIGDGLFRTTVRDSTGRTYTDVNQDKYGNIPKSAAAQAELIRTPKGAVVWFQDSGVPGAGYSDYLGTVSVGSMDLTLAQWRSVFTFVLTNQELAAWEHIDRANQALLKDTEGMPWGSLDYRAELRMTQPRDELEVSVEPQRDYLTWVPKGNMGFPDKAGSLFKVSIRVHKKGDPSTPRRARLILTLPEVSRNKGVSMNWPEEGASGEGLRFLPEDYQDSPTLVVKSSTRLESTEAVEGAEVVLECFDYGAWATLNIRAVDEQSRDAKVVIRGKETRDLTIPRDENGNHIADGWEEANGVGGFAAASDNEDDPPGRGYESRGDGLSLYEEYRGFRVQARHEQGDPNRKDLFVCDETPGFVAGAGIDLFERATRIKVHRVLKEELGPTRIINRNGAGETHLVDQHGVRIVSHEDGSPIAVPATGSGAYGPPAMTLEIQLPVGRNYDSGDGQADVAHELCHAVGADHHGEGMVAAVWSWQQLGDGAWQLTEQGLNVTGDTVRRVGPVKPIRVFFENPLREFLHGDAAPGHFAWSDKYQGWKVVIGLKGGEFSGDQECLMRYADKQAYASDKEPDSVRYIPDEGQWKMRTRLCEHPRGTGVNESGHAPQPRYGDAALGDCKGQIIVNDRYAGK